MRKFTLLSILLTASFLAALVWAAEPATQPATPPTASEEMGAPGCMAMCKAMMEKRKKAEADLTAMDKKIVDLVAVMNAAKGDKRIEAMAAVVNELASQRKAMRETMAGLMTMGSGCGMGGPGMQMEKASAGTSMGGMKCMGMMGAKGGGTE